MNTITIYNLQSHSDSFNLAHFLGLQAYAVIGKILGVNFTRDIIKRMGWVASMLFMECRGRMWISISCLHLSKTRMSTSTLLIR